MDKIVMNDVEKQVFSQICLGNVIRKTLINVIIERNICSVPTLDRTLKKFQRCGLVEKEKRGRYPLTQEGREEKKRRKTKPIVTFKNSGLAKVIAKLPTEAHQGLIYFILATIVAKKYLAEELGEKGIWGNFIISGRPKDIKTLLGEIVCRTLDLPFEKHIQRCIGKSEAQVLGEATFIDPKDKLRKLRLPPYLLYLFIVWDDLDKASTKGAWDALLVYLDGRYKFEERYTPITKQVTTLATMNPKKKGGFDIPDYYLRRAFTVNSANLPCDQKENEIIGTDITDNPIPELKIDALVVVKHVLKPDEKVFIRDLLYDRWITEEAKGVVDANLLHAVILGMLILQESVDVRYYSYWAVLHYLCFLETLGYTKGSWQEELTQEWGDYVVGSGGDEKFKEEWEEQAKKVKEEKARIEKAKGNGKKEGTTKRATRKSIIRKYATKTDRLKEIYDFFKAVEKAKVRRVGATLAELEDDLKTYTPKKVDKGKQENLDAITVVVAEWEEMLEPYRASYEEELKQRQKAKETLDAILRLLTGTKTRLKRWRHKDKNGVLWTERVKPVIAKIGNVLDGKTQKKFYNKTYLYEIQSDVTALDAEVKAFNEELERKKKQGVIIPQLPLTFGDLTEEESEAVIGETIEQVGQPFKTTRTVPYWKYLLIKLDRKLKGKGKGKPKPREEESEFDGRPFEEGGKGFMGRDIDEL